MKRSLVSTILALSMLAPFAAPAARSEARSPAPPAAPSPERMAAAGPPLQNVVQVAAGEEHTCALMETGAVKCWGGNEQAQLGDGTTRGRSTPVDVSGLTGGVVALAASSYHTCALLEGGGAKCWGHNGRGQLGDGTTDWRITPVDVAGLPGKVTALAAGRFHTCALLTGGGLMCWGQNSNGQLGDGTTDWHSFPTGVSGLSSGVVAVAAGGYHTCALLAGGGVKCWGRNANGQLGDGTTTHRSTPDDVAGLTSGVAVVATGGYHTCAVLKGGGTKCWGANEVGQLGDGTTEDRSTPTAVGSLPGAVIALALGYGQTCAFVPAGAAGQGALATGGAKCWGHNGSGQLGDGTTTDRSTPNDVSGLTSGITALAVGSSHGCAVLEGGGVKCWGDNWNGQLGDGTATNREVPWDVNGLMRGVDKLMAGGGHTCVALSGESVKCWGGNSTGQLGDGTTILRSRPVAVSGLAGGVVALAAGDSHTCAIVSGVTAGEGKLAGSRVQCWGANAYGQLGDGSTTDRSTPTYVSGLTSGVVAVTAGFFHGCAALSGGGVKCWGANWNGQLGDGTTTDRSTPADVIGLTSDVTALALGYNHTCALLTGGGVQCWGANGNGQLGDGTTTDRGVPGEVVGLTTGVVALAAGQNHTCALLDGGEVRCWGWNRYGQLGDGTSMDRSTPTQVIGLTGGVAAVAAGWLHTCALLESGGVKCWGRNSYGQLGDGTIVGRNVPVEVNGLKSGATDLTAGYGHTCALVGNGRPKCWGWDGVGQLGLGTITYRLTPVDVVTSVPPELGLNYPSGQPGSTFTLTGQGFPASRPLTIAINSQVVSDTLTTNETGGFIVFLDAAVADEGGYWVNASVNPNASAFFTLKASAPLRVQEGGGIVIAVPPSLGVPVQGMYLPIVVR